jgi:hypothetical protein
VDSDGINETDDDADYKFENSNIMWLDSEGLHELKESIDKDQSYQSIEESSISLGAEANTSILERGELSLRLSEECDWYPSCWVWALIFFVLDLATKSNALVKSALNQRIFLWALTITLQLILVVIITNKGKILPWKLCTG